MEQYANACEAAAAQLVSDSIFLTNEICDGANELEAQAAMLLTASNLARGVYTD